MNDGNQKTYRILRRKDVEAKVGLKRSSIYKLLLEGRFPKPIRLSSRAIGWLSSEIDQWLKERAANR